MRMPINLERFILEDQHAHPQATEELSQLLMRFGLAGKRIAHELSLAGLRRLHGSSPSANASGEEQKKLDVVANDILLDTFDYGGLVSVAASEELEEPHVYRGDGSAGRYAILFDPMDGSSNIDVNRTLGTIFSVRKRDGRDETVLVASGDDQVAAGYTFSDPPCCSSTRCGTPCTSSRSILPSASSF
jgi:fructose-1,6-bisphosphatase I